MNSNAKRVLHELRATQKAAVSGEELASKLRVSRNQIWKHIQELRDLGYAIEGNRGGGYQLVTIPDRLYPAELQTGLSTQWMANSIDYHDQCDSTNRIAFDAARAGAPQGHCVIAEAQQAGRGRLGRSFFSPAYQNLYLSLLLRPKLLIGQAATLILSTALAVARSVAEFLTPEHQVDIKWPNDVQINGKKVSGILLEMNSEATQIDFLVVGIGVNLNVDPQSFPTEFRRRATSLCAERGKAVSRLAFTQRLFENLELLYDQHFSQGFDALRPEFMTRFSLQDRTVTVLESDGGTIRGRVQGIDHDGALLLQPQDSDTGKNISGNTLRVLAGDVTLAKEEDSA